MPPRVVATIGLHGSASTWVFNVARELMTGAHAPRLRHGYADMLQQVPRDVMDGATTACVLKSHSGSPELDDWLLKVGATVLLSVRDPRDASISLVQRFRSPLSAAAPALRRDCDRVARWSDRGCPVFRYEDRFFGQPRSVDRLAALLDVQASAEARAAIFARYETEAVRSTAASLVHQDLSALKQIGPFRMDPVTQILETHIGDGRTGKWRGLQPPVQAELTRFFDPFLARFGYARN
jgi:hypothetical protein